MILLIVTPSDAAVTTTTTTTPTTTSTTTSTTTKPTTTPAANDINCNFESGSCGWVQDTKDTFNWTPRSGPTSTTFTGDSAGVLGFPW